MDLVVLEDNMERAGVILVLTGSILLMGLLEYLFFKKKYKIRNPISFFELFKKTDLPILAFENNGKTFYFLIDTGSAVSCIRDCYLDEFEYENAKGSGSVHGIDGVRIKTKFVIATLTQEGNEYKEVFGVHDVAGFDVLENDCGIKLSGIIGTSFMLRYNINIDFDQMLVYSKGKIYGKETKIQAIKSRWLRKLFGRNKRKK